MTELRRKAPTGSRHPHTLTRENISVIRACWWLGNNEGTAAPEDAKMKPNAPSSHWLFRAEYFSTFVDERSFAVNKKTAPSPPSLHRE